MKFHNFRLSSFLPHLFIGAVYPLYKYLSGGRSLLDGINALTFSGLAFLLIGVFVSMILHGDFDITAYVAGRALHKKGSKDYRAYKQDKDEDHAAGFNYPLLTAFVLLAAAIALTVFCY